MRARRSHLNQEADLIQPGSVNSWPIQYMIYHDLILFLIYLDSDTEHGTVDQIA